MALLQFIVQYLCEPVNRNRLTVLFHNVMECLCLCETCRN